MPSSLSPLGPAPGEPQRPSRQRRAYIAPIVRLRRDTRPCGDRPARRGDGRPVDPRPAPGGGRRGATSGRFSAPSRSCSSRSAWCSSARCRGSRSGSTGSTGRPSGTAVWRSPASCCCCPTSCCPRIRTARGSASRSARSGRSASWGSPSGRSSRAGSPCFPSAAQGLVREWQRKHPFRAGLQLLGGYERWRLLHRTTGLFVAAAFLHGVLDGTPFHHSPLLRWSYVAVGAIGVGFYVYRELLARFFASLHDYEVEAVHEVRPG